MMADMFHIYFSFIIVFSSKSFT